MSFFKNEDFFSSPYQTYRELARTGEPYWLAHEQAGSSDGILLFSRYKDADFIFHHYDDVSKDIRTVTPEHMWSAIDLNILQRDGQDHIRLRKIFSDFFSQKNIKTLENDIRNISKRTLNNFIENKYSDFVEYVSDKIPVYVIGNILGINDVDAQQIRKWSVAVSTGFDSVLKSPSVIDEQKNAFSEIVNFLKHQIEISSLERQNCLLPYMKKLKNDGIISSDEEIAMAVFMLFAGHETTVALLGSSIWLLLSHQEQWNNICHDKSLITNAVEESLRYESPIQRSSFRVATNDFTVNGNKVQKNQQFGVIIGAANRDCYQFHDADKFDIHRKNSNTHFAFGRGRYNCIGKGLARSEARILIDVIRELCPHIRLQNPQQKPVWRRNTLFRSLATLPVSVL